MTERKIDFDYLLLSWQDESPDSNYYLDTETGAVELVKRDLLDINDLTDSIERNHDRYLYVPKADRNEGRRDLAEFVETLTDQNIKRLLEVALEAPDPLHACRTILSKHEEHLRRWNDFRNRKLRGRIDAWLAANFITSN